MHVIQKSQAFTDTITFQTNGDAEDLTVHIKLNITPELIPQYRAVQLRLVELQKQNQTDPGNTEIVAGIGECIVQTMTLLFGEENTEVIIRFYDNDLAQMLMDVFPYIRDVIIPQIEKIAKERKQQYRKRI